MRNRKLGKMKRTPSTSTIVHKSSGVLALTVLWVIIGREGGDIAASAASSLAISSPPSCNIVTIFGLKTGDCNEVGLRNIPKTLDRDLRVLKFTENLLSSLKTDDFQTYIYLQEIYLVRNVLETIFPNAFRGLYSLQILDLEGNRLGSIRAYFFLGIASVRILSLRSNPIRSIEPNSFSTLVNLEELILENCWLDRIDPLLLKGLDKLIEINMVNNELQGFAAEMETHLPRSLRVFRLWKNHWQCDCHLRWFRQWLTTSLVNWDFPHNTPTCAAPEILNGVQWKHLTANQFACPSKILINSSTSIEVLPGSNVTVDCVVIGDPEPSVFWTKDTQAIDKQYVSHRRFLSQTNDRSIRSSLLLTIVSPSDAGDYRCVAENSAGRSEVTFKLWVEQQRPDAPDVADTDRNQPLSANQEIFLGVAIGGTLLLVGLIFCVVCIVRRTDGNRNPIYRSRGYKDGERDGAGGDMVTDNGSVVKTAEDDEEDSAKEDVLVSDSEKCLSSTLRSLLAGKEVVGGGREKDQTAGTQPEPIDLDVRYLTVEGRETSGQIPNKTPSAAGASGPVIFGGELLRTHGAIERESVQGAGGGQVVAKAAPSKERNSLKEETPDLLSNEGRALTDRTTIAPVNRSAKSVKVSFAVGESSDFPRTPSLKRAQENPYAKFSELHHHGSSVRSLFRRDEQCCGGGCGPTEVPDTLNDTTEPFRGNYTSNDPTPGSTIEWTEYKRPKTKPSESSGYQDGPTQTLPKYYCSAADASRNASLVPVASCPSLPKISFADTSYRRPPTGSRTRAVPSDAQSYKPASRHQADARWTTEFGVPHPANQHWSSSSDQTNVLHKSRSHGTLHSRPSAPPTQCRLSSFAKTSRYQKCPTTIALPASIVGITQGLFPVPPFNKPAADVVHRQEEVSRKTGRRDGAKDAGSGETGDGLAHLPTKSDSTLKRKHTKPHLGTTV